MLAKPLQAKKGLGEDRVLGWFAWANKTHLGKETFSKSSVSELGESNHLSVTVHLEGRYGRCIEGDRRPAVLAAYRGVRATLNKTKTSLFENTNTFQKS